MTRIRTTNTPETVIDVSESELVDLERQGLVHSREKTGSERIRKGEHAWKGGEAEEPAVAPTPLTKTPDDTEGK